MIVEDERDENEAVNLDYEQIDEVNNPPIQVSLEHANGFMAFIQSHERIRDQKSIINSNWTLSIIYDNYMVSHRNFKCV